ncbi:hypothetical protein COS91_01770 [Candidatus Desantisbacteria bacterium CG07_land_8_20_14_0_80_39_15]|uniref:Uncharacterized protein n=3 Tax=unclassified Candidatus Desantisiibacteriota TaxID=3106372 RepID=A0A2M6ZHW8_9BACT|nr:MAG: hypothetical protein COS91_01770 [Candidatus Desantisbacteria bacterium CG07_land_8_20_14_0_80_39_15]
MNIETLKSAITKLNRHRYFLEKRCQRIGKMLPASLILRAFPHSSDTSYAIAQTKPHPRYGYITYFDGTTTRHKYIPKRDLDNAVFLTGNYRNFCKWMKEIRSLSRQILQLLDKIGELQTLPISSIEEKEDKRK